MKDQDMLLDESEPAPRSTCLTWRRVPVTARRAGLSGIALQPQPRHLMLVEVGSYSTGTKKAGALLDG